MKQKNFSIVQRFTSFGYAFNGLKIMLKEEHNSRIHLLAAIMVVIAGFFFQLSALEWTVIVFAIGMVFAFELMNSAIENIADFVSPGKNHQIKKIKDLSAAAVLMAVITTVVIGLIVFVPKIISML